MIPFFQEVKNKLDAVSPSFCLAKWKTLTLHLGLGENHSCYHPPMHKVDPEAIKLDPSALHNTANKKKIRGLMKQGIRPTECNYCWHIEDLEGNHASDRVRHSSSPDMIDDLDDIKNMPFDQNVNPRWLELSFSNHCNFKCSYCSPGASSRWRSEIEEFGGYPVRNDAQGNGPDALHHQYKEEENPYIDAFWKWWPDAYPELRTLRITGGEPMMTTNYFKVIDYILEVPNKNLAFNVNTNLGVPTKTINKFITAAQKIQASGNIKSLGIYTSMDTSGQAAEYIRNGLVNETYYKHLDMILEQVPNIEVSFMITFGPLSLFNFTEFLDTVIDYKKRFPNNKIGIGIAILNYPSHFDLKILPTSFKHWFDKITKYFEDNKIYFPQHERDFWRTLTTHWETNVDDNGHLADRIDFYKFFSEHDRRRKTDILSAVPEIADFYNFCKLLAEDNQ
jgi:hypothetical protein